MTLSEILTHPLIIFPYIGPMVIAIIRNHQSMGGIAVINLLLGWTVIGWIIALAWSLSEVRQRT